MNLPDHIPDSHRLVTAEQSRETDHRTISEFGISGFTLMEIAATGAAGVIAEKVPRGSSGIYLAGKGNNSGDALAVARILSQQQNHSVTICMVMGSDDLSLDAAANLTLLNKLQDQGEKIRIVTGSDDQLPDFSEFDYAVDGIFGTGLTSVVREPISGMIDRLNGAGITVFSMDIPSGLHADSGEIMGTAVRADYTAVFGTMKIGLWCGEARSVRGKTRFIPLPFPRFLRDEKAQLITTELNSLFPDAVRSARHKYDGGVVHIVAGSQGMTGAAIMAAKAAWKHGAGAVFLYSPADLMPVYESELPHIIKVPLGDADEMTFRNEHAGEIQKRVSEKPGVLLMGPGLGQSDSVKELVQTLLDNRTEATLLDADALYAITPEQLKERRDKNSKIILTPHPGEAKSALGLSFGDDAEKACILQNFTKETGCTVFLKGNPGMLSSPHHGLYLTGYDTSPFTRAGFGDVLAGTISAIYGFTEESVPSVIRALLIGCKRQQLHESGTPFGPEHLL